MADAPGYRKSVRNGRFVSVVFHGIGRALVWRLIMECGQNTVQLQVADHGCPFWQRAAGDMEHVAVVVTKTSLP